MLPLETMLISMVMVPVRAVSGSVVLLKLRTVPVNSITRCRTISQETMWKSMIHAPTDCKGQGSYFAVASMTHS